MALQRSAPGSEYFPGLQLGDHWCLPVGGDGERLSATAEFVGTGLGGDGKVAVLTATETPEQMGAYLAARVPGARAARAIGRLSVLACHDFYRCTGVFDPAGTVARYTAEIDLAEQQGYPGLWVVVDMAWAQADASGIGLLPDYEAGVNPGFADRRVAAACIYDRSRFCRTLIEEVCSAHPLTPGQAPLRFAWTTDPPGLTLSGEVDLTNHRAITPLLHTLHALPGHVTIDATGLQFADLRAADLLFDVPSARATGTTTINGSVMVSRLLDLVADCRSRTGGQPDA